MTPPSKGRSPSVLSAQDLNSPRSVSDNYISDVDTLSVSSTGTTPEFSKMSLGRGRGRPRKNLVVPSTDDFPYDGTQEERDRYLKKKRQKCGVSRNLLLLVLLSTGQEKMPELRSIKRRKKWKKCLLATPTPKCHGSRSLLVLFLLNLRVVPHGTKGAGPKFVTRPVCASS